MAKAIQNKPISIDTNADPSSQMRNIARSIEQLWSGLTQLKSQLGKINLSGYALKTELHDSVTVSDSDSVDFTLTGQQISAAVLPAGVDHNGLANLTTGDVHTQYLNTTRGDARYDALGDASTVQSNLNTHAGLTTTAHGGIIGGSGTQYRIPRMATTTTLGDSPIYTDEANTMVGIGAVPTTGLLHIKQNGSLVALLDNTHASSYGMHKVAYNTTGAYIALQQTGPSWAYAKFGQVAGSQAALYTEGASSLSIGTLDASPVVFGVDGGLAMTIAATKAITIESTLTTKYTVYVGTASTSPGIVMSGTGNNAGYFSARTQAQYWYFFSGTDGNSPYMAFVGKDYPGTLTPGVHLMLSSAASSFSVYNGNADYVMFRAVGGGNIEIPRDDKKLVFGASLSASIGYTTNLVINTRENGTGDLVVSGGNLAVGTTADTSRKLTVYNTASTMVASFKTNQASAYIGFVSTGTTDNTYVRVGASGDDLLLFAGGSERARIVSAGNSGFGFTAPLAKVAINGGLHVGGESDPGDNNLLVDGTCKIVGAGGFNNVTPSSARTHVADPSGGSVIDVEARAAINALLATLEAFGLHATA